ncbi:MAG: hypothetical protein K2M64_03285, partial [Clostridia bacterium]|nr:hypothetical protein [Clostridia bacterium]
MIIYDKRSMTDVDVVGGKGLGLAKLHSYGFNVPDFFVIGADTDVNNELFAAELDSFAANLDCNLFAVRSSSVNEDASDGSFAGQFSTLLDVPYDNLLQAVQNVMSSCKNNRVTKYSQHFNTTSGGVAVVVQKQIHGDCSGVMFTTSPYNDGEVVIESIQGGGESLVSGIASPDEMTYNKGEQVEDDKYMRLLTAAAMLEKSEGHPLDIEWTYCGDTLYLLQMRPLTAVGDPLPEICDGQWNMYVYRDFCLFSHGIQRIASKPQVQQKYFGFAVPIFQGLIVNGREFYTTESDAKANELWEKLDTVGFFEKFIKQIKTCVLATHSRANKLKKLDCSKMQAQQLFALYKYEIKAYIKSYVPLMMRPDDYLYGKLIDLVGEKRAEIIAGAAAISNKKTYYAGERSKFLSSVVNGDIDAYLKDYEWMGSPLGKKCVTLDRSYFSKRTIGLTPLDANKKLDELHSLRKRDMAYRRKITSELANDEQKILFNLISEFIYLRTYTAENSDRYFYYIRKNILENIARLIGVDIDVLLLMSPEEVEKTENGFRLSPREIAKRKSGEVVVVTEGESSVYYTGKSYSLLKELLPKQVNDGAFALEGKIACMGEVCAKVKIINNMQQAEDFEDGCILVTTMTVPEITSAIEKASGIITDEGGITCHAAIIAREYSVPCLVGTKNATAVLKDGDYVQLDCINGR